MKKKKLTKKEKEAKALKHEIDLEWEMLKGMRK